MSAATTALRGQAMAARLMTSACTVFAPGEPVTDPQTLEVSESQDVVWTGPCRIRPSGGGGSVEVAGTELFAFDWQVAVPFDAAGINEGHRLTVTASPDREMAGITMEVQRVDRGDTITARRLYCRLVD